MLRQLKSRRHLATTLFLLSLAALTLVRLTGSSEAKAAPAALIAALGPRRAPGHRNNASDRSHLPSGLDWSRVRADGDGYVAIMPDGRRYELTLDPRLQQKAEHLLREHATPYSAAVMISVSDGRILAMAGQSTAEPERNAADLALKPWAPAASIFKLVTAAALVERGVHPDARVCYHDGIHSVEASNLKPQPRRDDACATFAYGIAKSQNAIIARLAYDHLDEQLLGRAAHALGFGQPLPFELPVEPSSAALPAHGTLAFARVAAGFWQTTLSPLHGAWLAATLARGGVTPPLRLIDRVVARDGEAQRPPAAPAQRVLGESAARTVGQMMVGTTEYGTARLGFRDRRTNRPLLPGVAVAGKTGSLDRRDPAFPWDDNAAQPSYLAYSWFVGFAPAERPEVAVAVLIGNGASWRVKAHQVARALLSGYFHGEAPTPPRTRLASR